MPKGYEDMRDEFMRGQKKTKTRKGGKPMKKKAAQGKAARIWNSLYPGNPVGRGRK